MVKLRRELRHVRGSLDPRIAYGSGRNTDNDELVGHVALITPEIRIKVIRQPGTYRTSLVVL